MGAGKGKSRRLRAVASPPRSLGLSVNANELFERAVSSYPGISPDEVQELLRWAREYSDKGDLRYSAALTLYTLTGYAEENGRKIDKRDPDKQREIMFSRAQQNWKNYTDLRITAEFEAMHYLVQEHPETEVELNEFQQADYEEALQELGKKTGMQSFKTWPVYKIPKNTDDPIVRFLNESYVSESPCSATFVPDNETGLAAPPIIVTEGLTRIPGLPVILVHESTHLAYKHATRVGSLGSKAIEGCTDSLTWLAVDRDDVLYERDPERLGYANEIKFALAFALTRPCGSRDELIRNISKLSTAVGVKKNNSNAEAKIILSEYTGVSKDKVDWRLFYEANAVDETVGVNELRDRIVALAPDVFAGLDLSRIEDVTAPW